MKNKSFVLIIIGAVALVNYGRAQIFTDPIPETTVPTVIVGTKSEPIANITLLGSDEKVEWAQTAEAVTVKAPTKSLNNIAIVFTLTL